MNTEERLRNVLQEQLGLSYSPELDLRLIADLGCDSLDMVEIAMAVEDEFAIEIVDEAGEKCVTVGDCLALVESLLKEAA